MSRFTPSRLVALCLALSALLAPASRAEDAGQAAIKKAIAEAKEKLEDCFDQALQESKEMTAAAKTEFDAGTFNLDDLNKLSLKLTSKLSSSLADHRTWVTFELIQKISAIQQLHPESTKDALKIGSGGAFDQWSAYSKERLDKVYGKGVKKFAKFVKSVLKQLFGAQQIRLQALPPSVPADAPGSSCPGQNPLSIAGLGSAHSTQVPNDGKLYIGGLAPLPGAEVAVKICGPNGATLTKIVTAGADRQFEVGFPSLPGEGPGTLAEGNWRIEASSAGQLASAAHGI